MAVISKSKAREVGFVCDWCGKVGPVNMCSIGKGEPGHSRICSNCLQAKGWKHTHCQMPGCAGWVQRHLPTIAQGARGKEAVNRAQSDT